MNTAEFVVENFGRYMFAPTGDVLKDANRAVNGHVPMRSGSRSRLMSGFAIIRADAPPSVQMKVAVPGVIVDERPWFEPVVDELENWTGSPRMFLRFGKGGFPLDRIFVTYDLRAVRLCTPVVAPTFDWLAPGEGEHPWVRRLRREKDDRDAG